MTDKKIDMGLISDLVKKIGEVGKFKKKVKGLNGVKCKEI